MAKLFIAVTLSFITILVISCFEDELLFPKASEFTECDPHCETCPYNFSFSIILDGINDYKCVEGSLNFCTDGIGDTTIYRGVSATGPITFWTGFNSLCRNTDLTLCLWKNTATDTIFERCDSLNCLTGTFWFGINSGTTKGRLLKTFTIPISTDTVCWNIGTILKEGLGQCFYQVDSTWLNWIDTIGCKELQFGCIDFEPKNDLCNDKYTVEIIPLNDLTKNYMFGGFSWYDNNVGAINPDGGQTLYLGNFISDVWSGSTWDPGISSMRIGDDFYWEWTLGGNKTGCVEYRIMINDVYTDVTYNYTGGGYVMHKFAQVDTDCKVCILPFDYTKCSL